MLIRAYRYMSGPESIRTYLAAIRDATAADVRDSARRFLGFDGVTVGLEGPAAAIQAAQSDFRF